jgi:voltage-gated potassium channel Kch
MRRHLLERIVGPVPGVRWLVFSIVLVSIACAVLARLIAPDDFPTLGRSFWWSVQTVTTVGYGDVTPASTAGRTVAAVLMVTAFASLSVLTAAISAAFVRRMQARRGLEDPLVDALTKIESRLAALEAAISDPEPARGSRAVSDH